MMFVLLVVQIIILIYAGIQKDKFIGNMGEVIDKIWENAKKHPNSLNYMSSIELSVSSEFVWTPKQNFQFKSTYNKFQYKCCGKNGPSDYLDPIFNQQFPVSCCEEQSDPKTCYTMDKYYKNGCRSSFTTWWTDNWSLLYKILIGIGVVEVFIQNYIYHIEEI